MKLFLMIEYLEYLYPIRNILTVPIIIIGFETPIENEGVI